MLDDLDLGDAEDRAGPIPREVLARYDAPEPEKSMLKWAAGKVFRANRDFRSVLGEDGWSVMLTLAYDVLSRQWERYDALERGVPGEGPATWLVNDLRNAVRRYRRGQGQKLNRAGHVVSGYLAPHWGHETSVDLAALAEREVEPDPWRMDERQLDDDLGTVGCESWTRIPAPEAWLGPLVGYLTRDPRGVLLPPDRAARLPLAYVKLPERLAVQLPYRHFVPVVDNISSGPSDPRAFRRPMPRRWRPVAFEVPSYGARDEPRDGPWQGYGSAKRNTLPTPSATDLDVKPYDRTSPRSYSARFPGVSPVSGRPIADITRYDKGKY